MTKALTVRPATPQDLPAIQALCWDYRALLVQAASARPEIVEAYYAEADYAALMDALPQKHARPDGEMFVAELGGAVVGCGMTHRIDATTSEIKRVFTAPKARGYGAATGIIRAAMAQAKTDGYTRMVLDSMVTLEDAVRLYDGMGFTPCAPYYAPDPRFTDLLIFREIDLGGADADGQIRQ